MASLLILKGLLFSLLDMILETKLYIGLGRCYPLCGRCGPEVQIS